MITLTPLESLGHFKNAWLEARYHFSFSGYMDPNRMGVGALRVWNDDTIQAGGNFPPHPHRDMEIITFLRRGAITHEDNLGNRGVTKAGNVQVMSAGTGIIHSEANLEDEVTTLFQIWIEPAEISMPPRWETWDFPDDVNAGRFHTLASGRDKHDGALQIFQNAAVMGATIAPGEDVVHGLAENRQAYLVPARGNILVNGIAVSERAGVHVFGEEQITIQASSEAEVILVDVA
ncbi:MAG: pirin family protein [Rhodospirillales bacterium]|nr:pirin family protein [Rhodospirillales bacterium]